MEKEELSAWRGLSFPYKSRISIRERKKKRCLKALWIYTKRDE